MKKLTALCFSFMLLLTGLATTQALTPTTQTQTDHIATTTPTITTTSQDSTVTLPEATSYTSTIGQPILPCITKTYTFPLGTAITSVTFTTSPSTTTTLTQPIQLAPEPTLLTPNPTVTSSQTEATLPVQCSYRLGAGIQGTTHVLYLLVDFYPIQTTPGSTSLTITSSVDVTITYQLPTTALSPIRANTCLIITPANFTTALQPLITHKQHMGITIYLQTLENITATYPGRDTIEQIKYAIKDAIETNHIQSVLIVGGVDQIPIRTCAVTGYISRVEDDVISDLYYADIYNATGGFSTWDTNNNNIFGEDNDSLDLYPDVHLGRLACTTTTDIATVTDKIIHYETETNGSSWFHTMIFIGGDTFPGWGDNEGETLNLIIHNIMPTFKPVYIWTSNNDFTPTNINNAITQGAGFLDYSGHGFEHGIGTHKPNHHHMQMYTADHIKDIHNGYKLPIIYFDACLTAKLDYVLQDLLNYKPYFILNILAKLTHYNTTIRKPCFAWQFLTHPDGGAIATIGATRSAYGGNDEGAGKIAIEFFQTYNTSTYLGEMITGMQTNYIHDVPQDPFTVEEFLLLGDPTLRIGGYPT